MWLACSPATSAGNLCRVVFQDVRERRRECKGLFISKPFQQQIAGSCRMRVRHGEEYGEWRNSPKSPLHHNVWIPDGPPRPPEHLQMSMSRQQLPVGREPFSCTATLRISHTPRGLLDPYFHITLVSLL